MQLPTLRQFEILCLLPPDGIGGPELRSQLKGRRTLGTGRATFYDMMGRLADAGWVSATPEIAELHGESYQQNRYQITGTGHAAIRAFELKTLEAREARAELGWTPETGSVSRDTLLGLVFFCAVGFFAFVCSGVVAGVSSRLQVALVTASAVITVEALLVHRTGSSAIRALYLRVKSLWGALINAAALSAGSVKNLANAVEVAIAAFSEERARKFRESRGDLDRSRIRYANTSGWPKLTRFVFAIGFAWLVVSTIYVGLRSGLVRVFIPKKPK